MPDVSGPKSRTARRKRQARLPTGRTGASSASSRRIFSTISERRPDGSSCSTRSVRRVKRSASSAVIERPMVRRRPPGEGRPSAGTRIAPASICGGSSAGSRFRVPVRAGCARTCLRAEGASGRARAMSLKRFRARCVTACFAVGSARSGWAARGRSRESAAPAYAGDERARSSRAARAGRARVLGPTAGRGR